MDRDFASTFQKAGTIVKAHGLKGEVLVNVEVDLPELLEKQTLFYINNLRGDLAPRRVEKSYLANKKGRPSFFVKFESVDDRAQAERLVRRGIHVADNLYDQMMSPDNDMPGDELIGYVILDENDRNCGEVVDVLESPAHPILHVTSDGGPYMIPYVDEYIISVDGDRVVIHCRNLQPLMEV
ncbi:MAG TPA: ribosome maturation factor RimM [Balneolales bacterium]|nr:ribosome maturation factor RimM [Balneolales bacterium]